MQIYKITISFSILNLESEIFGLFRYYINLIIETTKDTRELYFDVVLDVKDYCSPSLFMED